jgi:hypothetical protein
MSERLLLLCGDLTGGTDDERVWMAYVACGARSVEI